MVSSSDEAIITEADTLGSGEGNERVEELALRSHRTQSARIEDSALNHELRTGFHSHEKLELFRFFVFRTCHFSDEFLQFVLL